MLNGKQKLFVEAYLRNGGNATQAAITAGYSGGKTARTTGARLLAHAGVSAALSARAGKITTSLEVTTERILLERARLAFFDPRKLLDNTGRPKPLHELDDDTAAAIAGVKVVNVGNEDVGEGEILDIKLADKNASLTALEKIQGMYKSGDEPAGVLNIHVHF